MPVSRPTAKQRTTSPRHGASLSNGDSGATVKGSSLSTIRRIRITMVVAIGPLLGVETALESGLLCLGSR